jgi:mannose-6-phosphate isomerase-like protein (cupin superfamily)
VIFDLRDTYVHLGPDGRAEAQRIDPDFWANVDQSAFASGRMLAVFEMDEDWSTWERHPDGEEVLSLLSGAMTMVLETPQGVARIALKPGDTLIVPLGVWHTAEVRELSKLLAITEGAGTKQRAA